MDADRCAMFLTDEKTGELHADLFDEGRLDDNGCDIFSKGREIRYGKLNDQPTGSLSPRFIHGFL